MDHTVYVCLWIQRQQIATLLVRFMEHKRLPVIAVRMMEEIRVVENVK